MAQDTLDDRLAALVGKPIGDTGPSEAPDPVNLPMIRHWAAAFEDANPVYTDPEAAQRSRFGDIVSGTTILESVSPQKQTRIGPGHFITWVTTYTDATGDVVGRQTFRILKFRPEGLPS